MSTLHDNIRLTMMRSIVMEPLASQIAAAAALDRFHVIIWLNEAYRGGVSGAGESVHAQGAGV